MLPLPRSVTWGAGEFELTARTGLSVGEGLDGVAHWLRGALGPALDRWLPPAGADGTIALAVDSALPASGYLLVVTRDGVTLLGGDPAGVFHGAQTLRQLLPPAAYRRAPVADGPWRIPAVTVRDAPRYGWRGCMLDVARHFMPKADVLRFVDLLAAHKLNVLHLHLTDDQGWRVEIPGYPLLTEVGGWRAESMVGSRQHGRFDGRPHGGYYTADDLREIVGYAAARFVTVVPEIDLPGHTQSAVAAYPWLAPGHGPVGVRTGWGLSPHGIDLTDDTLEFCRNVLDEVCALFPGEFIGIGGDECPPDQPLDARRRFGRALVDHLATHGRRAYAWDEILEGGAPRGVAVAAWRGPGVTRAAAEAGHDVVACPDLSTYLDYRQSDHADEPVPVGTVLTVDDVYAFDPATLAPDHPERLLGAQCNVWTEHMPTTRAVDYMVFPRLCAFAEVVWNSGRHADFRDRLAEHLPRLDAMGVEYRPEAGPLPWQRRPDAAGWPRDRADRESELDALVNAPR
ncbi:beta-N-acetylhexosaminidase [Longispora fulva]|uniref:beta-N-acetylhexosaminidase n=1 Tax=Longispora fulva TaxID=619741 RepID=A0A8J7KL94_9ACTN|nr:beta-N-acetylhexosaminidase [Longispora fulva]MBG6137691.1 hexosaminidase [Longispora fulva]GIG62152.1 beta-N-acetylhexosaminidase [Longispora fulva]